MKRLPTICALVALVAGALAAASLSFAQTPTNGPTTAPASTTNAPAPAKQVIALVSAVGDSFTYVRQKRTVGSNVIDNHFRNVLQVPGNGLNVAVLRGLDRGVAVSSPNSERIFITLKAEEMKDVLPQDREAVAIGKIVSALEKMPERAKWSKIIVAVPKFLLSERENMGPKLSGLGIYVQPLGSDSISGTEVNINGTDIDNGSDSKTATPQGKVGRSKQFVAPFSYIQVYTLDPKTMQVIEKNARHDYQKLSDPESTALDVEKSLPPEFLAARMERLIERSAARAAGEAEDATRIDIGDVKVVKPDAAPKK
jgi:hypothetical protein